MPYLSLIIAVTIALAQHKLSFGLFILMIARLLNFNNACSLTFKSVVCETPSLLLDPPFQPWLKLDEPPLGITIDTILIFVEAVIFHSSFDSTTFSIKSLISKPFISSTFISGVETKNFKLGSSMTNLILSFGFRFCLFFVVLSASEKRSSICSILKSLCIETEYLSSFVPQKLFSTDAPFCNL